MTEDFWAERASHQVIRAAGSENWNPLLHPRGPDGRFIRKNGWVRWLEKGKWRTGIVTHISPTDGSVTVKVAVKDPASLPSGANPEDTFKHNGKTVEKVFSEPGKFLYASEVPVGAPGSTATLSESLPSPATKEYKGWVKIGGQGGSNLGGKFTTPDGDEIYVKELETDRVREEVAAAKLYELAGTAVPMLHQRDLGHNASRIGSEIIPGNLTDLQEHLGDPDVMSKVRAGFVMDAWLANWDVIGLSYDNIVVDSGGVPWRIDVGGSLRYRAMGSPKGSAFGPEVGELETLRTKNSKGKVVYAGLTDAELKDGAERLAAISPVDVSRILDEAGLTGASKKELLDILLARRADILAKTGVEDPYKHAIQGDDGVFSSILPEGAFPASVGKVGADAVDAALAVDADLSGLRLSDGEEVAVGDFVHHLTKGKMGEVTALLPTMGKQGSVEVEDEEGKKWKWAVGKLVSDSQMSLDNAYADTPLADRTIPKIGMQVTSSGKSPVTGKIVSIDRKRKWITIAPADGSANKVRTASTTTPSGAETPATPADDFQYTAGLPEVTAPRFSGDFASGQAAVTKIRNSSLKDRYPELAAEMDAAMSEVYSLLGLPEGAVLGQDWNGPATPEQVDALSRALDAARKIVEREASKRGFAGMDIWGQMFDANHETWTVDGRSGMFSAGGIVDRMLVTLGYPSYGTSTTEGIADMKTYTVLNTRLTNIPANEMHPSLRDALLAALRDSTTSPEVLRYISSITPASNPDYGKKRTPWGTYEVSRATDYDKRHLDALLDEIRAAWPKDLSIVSYNHGALESPDYKHYPALKPLKPKIDEYLAALQVVSIPRYSLEPVSSHPSMDVLMKFSTAIDNSRLSYSEKALLKRMSSQYGFMDSDLGKVMQALEVPGDDPITLNDLPSEVLHRILGRDYVHADILDKVWLAVFGGREKMEATVTEARNSTAQPFEKRLGADGLSPSAAYLRTLVLKMDKFGVESLSDPELALMSKAFVYSEIEITDWTDVFDRLSEVDLDADLGVEELSAIYDSIFRAGTQNLIPLKDGHVLSMAEKVVYDSKGDRVAHLNNYGTTAARVKSMKDFISTVKQHLPSKSDDLGLTLPDGMEMPPSHVTSGDPISEATFAKVVWALNILNPKSGYSGKHNNKVALDGAKSLLAGTLSEQDAEKLLNEILSKDMFFDFSITSKGFLMVDPFTKQYVPVQTSVPKTNVLAPPSVLAAIQDKITELKNLESTGAGGTAAEVFDGSGALALMSQDGIDPDNAPSMGSAIGSLLSGGGIQHVHFDSDAIDNHKVNLLLAEDENGNSVVRVSFAMTGGHVAEFNDTHVQLDPSDDADESEISRLQASLTGLKNTGSYTPTTKSLEDSSEMNPLYVCVELDNNGQPVVKKPYGVSKHPPNGTAVGVVQTDDGPKVRVIYSNGLGYDEMLVGFRHPSDATEWGFAYEWIGIDPNDTSDPDTPELTVSAKEKGWTHLPSVGWWAKQGKDGKVVVRDPAKNEPTLVPHDSKKDNSPAVTMDESSGSYYGNGSEVTIRGVGHTDDTTGTRIETHITRRRDGVALTPMSSSPGGNDVKSKTVVSTHVAVNIPLPENLTPEQQQEFIASQLSISLQRMGVAKEKHRAPTTEEMRDLAIRSLYRTFVASNQTLMAKGAISDSDMGEIAKQIEYQMKSITGFPQDWKFDFNRDIVLYRKADGTLEPRWSPEMTESLVRLTNAASFSSYSGSSGADAIISRLHTFLDPTVGKGGFMSSSDRAAHGIATKGQSTGTDMRKAHSGEGVYLTKRGAGNALNLGGYSLVTYMNPSSVLSQLSIWANYNDTYGTRVSGVGPAYADADLYTGGWDSSDPHVYEVLTKSIVEPGDIAFFVVDPSVISTLKSRGITEIHGRPIDEILIPVGSRTDMEGHRVQVAKMLESTNPYTSLSEDRIIRNPFGPPANPDTGLSPQTDFQPTGSVIPDEPETLGKLPDTGGSLPHLTPTTVDAAPVGKTIVFTYTETDEVSTLKKIDANTWEDQDTGTQYSAALLTMMLTWQGYATDMPATPVSSSDWNTVTVDDAAPVETVKSLEDSPVGAKVVLLSSKAMGTAAKAGVPMMKSGDDEWVALDSNGNPEGEPVTTTFLQNYVGKKTTGLKLKWLSTTSDSAGPDSGSGSGSGAVTQDSLATLSVGTKIEVVDAESSPAILEKMSDGTWEDKWHMTYTDGMLSAWLSMTGVSAKNLSAPAPAPSPAPTSAKTKTKSTSISQTTNYVIDAKPGSKVYVNKGSVSLMYEKNANTLWTLYDVTGGVQSEVESGLGGSTVLEGAFTSDEIFLEV